MSGLLRVHCRVGIFAEAASESYFECLASSALQPWSSSSSPEEASSDSGTRWTPLDMFSARMFSEIQFLLSEPPPISWFYLPNFLSSLLHCKIHSAEMLPVLFSWPVLIQGKTWQGWVFQSFLKLKMPNCWKLITRETFLLLPTTAAAIGSPTALRARAARSYPPSLWAGVPCPQGPCGVTFLPRPVWSVRHGSLPFSNTQIRSFPSYGWKEVNFLWD